MTGNTPEFSRRVPFRELPDTGRKVRFEAAPEELAALAARLGVPAVECLTAEFFVVPEGGGAQARGRFEAVVEQRCVVSLEPVTSRVSEDIEQAYAAAGPTETVAEIEIDALAGDPPEPLSGGALELGELVAEHLALALDPYPRRPDAGADLPADEDGAPESPFAKLRDLKISATEG